MNISVAPGNYVVAVSGGVDSVALLDLLSHLPGLRLTVAHFDHGIRPDSAADALFVEQLAQKYAMPFVTDRVGLGSGASEARARQFRYQFLFATCSKNQATLLTAHHLDDRLETAIFNIIRGSGRLGLSSLRSNQKVLRPLLAFPKADVVNYARENHLSWHEDSTNTDTSYSRNYIRQNILPGFKIKDREMFCEMLETAAWLNDEIEPLLGRFSATDTLDRRQFILLPHVVAREVIASWLRRQSLTEIDSKLVERLVHAGKTFHGGQRVSVSKNYDCFIGHNFLALRTIER